MSEIEYKSKNGLSFILSKKDEHNNYLVVSNSILDIKKYVNFKNHLLGNLSKKYGKSTLLMKNELDKYENGTFKLIIPIGWSESIINEIATIVDNVYGLYIKRDN